MNFGIRSQSNDKSFLQSTVINYDPGQACCFKHVMAHTMYFKLEKKNHFVKPVCYGLQHCVFHISYILFL